MDPNLGLDADYLTSWDPFQFYLSDSTPASKGFFLSVSPIPTPRGCWLPVTGLLILLPALFAQRNGVSIQTGIRHPFNASTYSRSSFGHLQAASFCYFRCYFRHDSHHHSSLPSLPTLLWVPLRVLRANALSYIQDFKSWLCSNKCNCIWQNLNSGYKQRGKFGDGLGVLLVFVSFSSKPLAGEIIIWGCVISARENNIASNCHVVFD